MANYVDLIGRVISDFDSIYDALVAKGVADAAHKHDGTIKTDEYDNLISGTLTHIKGVTTGAPDEINNYNLTGQSAVVTTISTGTSVVAAGTSGYNLSFTGVSEGYYGANSAFLANIPVEQISVDTKVASLTAVTSGDVQLYNIAATTGKLIDSVTVNKGSVTVSTAASDVTDTSTFTTTDTLDPKGLQVSDNQNAYEEYVTVEYTTTINRAGKLTVDPTITKTAGYIKSEDVVTTGAKYEYDFSAANDNAGTHIDVSGKKTLYIKKGSVEISEADGQNATASVSSTQVAWIDADKATTDNSIEIKASVSNIALKGTFTPGYVDAETTIDGGNIAVGDGSKFLKKGSVSSLTGDDKIVPTMTVSGNNLTEVKETLGSSDTESNYHKITVTASATETGEIDPGYISGTSYSVAVDNKKDIYIRQGSAAITAEVGASITTGESYFTDSADEGIEIVLTPSLTLGKTVTTGYLTATDVDIANGKTITPTTTYLKTGSATVTRSLSAVLTEVAGDGAGGSYTGEGETKTLVDIFETDLSKVSGRDYYTITADAAVTSSDAGYMTGSDVSFAGTAPVKYLPKADLRWVETTGEDGVVSSILHVIEGGYLPSGILTEIDTTESSLVKAAVGVIAGEGSSSIFTTSVLADGYHLNITKGKVSAGYISSADGTVSGDFYIQKGSVGITATNAFTKQEITSVKAEDNKTVTGYTLSLTGATTTTLNVGEGYVEHKNITLNDAVYSSTNKTLTTDTSTTVNLGRAALQMAEGSQAINLGVSVDDKIAYSSETESAYVIRPTIEGNSKVQIIAGTAGYLAEGDGAEIQILSNESASAAAPIYLQAGTAPVVSEVNENSLVATPDFSDTAKGENDADLGYYVVNVGGEVAVDVTLTPGYYGATEVTAAKVAQTLTVEGTELHIDKAVSTTTLTASSSVEADTAIVFATNVDSGKSYATITAPVVATSTTVVSKAGYVKNGEVGPTEATTTLTAGTAKIELFETATATLNSKNGEEIPTEAATVVIPTQNKYATTDVTVTIGENAMGMAVAGRLNLLEQRLNGYSGKAATTV